jgi:hypothetical protein
MTSNFVDFEEDAINNSSSEHLGLNIERFSVEDIYSNLIRKATGGVKVRSSAAPALATQFVKSNKRQVARAGTPGAFAEIIFPGKAEIEQKIEDYHDEEEFHLYHHTKASAAYHAGYGERSARALAKEESTYQLKGVFQAAALAYSKLRARIDARDGDTSSIDNIFSHFWGLQKEEVESIPKLYVTGSEAQRLSAMEDRAYHSIAAHPSIAGGFRVNTATLAPDVLGDDVPMNWPRLRTGVKAIAMVQLSGDMRMLKLIQRVTRNRSFTICFDITENSQPVYSRPVSWERIVEKLVMREYEFDSPELLRMLEDEVGYSVRSTLAEAEGKSILENPNHQLARNVQEIASFVESESSTALGRTIEVILEYKQARAQISELNEEGFVEMDQSKLSETFEVKKYKVKRTTMYSGTTKEKLGRSGLPDVTYHGRERTILDMDEIRDAGLTLNLDIPGALNMAVYMAVRNHHVRPSAYRFMTHMAGIMKGDTSTRPIAERLRNPALYSDQRTREYGPMLFGYVFIQTLDMLFKNMVSRDYKSDLTLKREIWDYLSARTGKRRPCPIPGDWRDLIPFLHTAPEGWTLYYWVRIGIGKLHHQACSSILAPVTAGVDMDVLTMVRKGIKERATMWAEHYTGKYREIEASIKSLREQLDEAEAKKEQRRASGAEETKKYVPPALRQLKDLDAIYVANHGLDGAKGFTSEQYERMVEYQSKSKFFSAMEVYSIDRQITVGVSDEKMLAMLIEFYQARWDSLEKRAKRAQKYETVFYLGEHCFDCHPWGELVEEFPTDVPSMLEFMASLDPRAWTVPPVRLYEKFVKSISELWADVREEISKLNSYVMELHEGALTEQEDAMALSEAEKITNATNRLSAIEIPVVGYRQVHTMPTRNISYVSTSNTPDGPIETAVQVSTSTDTFLAPSSNEEDRTGNLDDDLPDDDDWEFDENDLPEDDTDVREIEMTPCLSINQIWHILGLDEVDDNRKRFCLGAPIDYDLNDQHIESGYGPMIVVGEEAQVQRKWRNYVPSIMQRLKNTPPPPPDDDMQS